MKRLLFKTGLACLLGLTSVLFVLGLMARLGSAIKIAYAAGPRYVAPGGADSGNDCSNSASPCATIQHAVDVAAPGDVIKVATGVYTGINTYGGLAQVVYISKTLTLQGGYTSAFTEPPNPTANPTTLDAQGQGRVIYITGNINVTVEGLQITGGNATGLGNHQTDVGGGVYVVTATTTLKDNTIFSNTATTSSQHGYGGGVSLLSSIATLQNNHIFNNSAHTTIGSFGEGEGGGVYLEIGTVTLDNNLIQNNLASLDGEGAGGGAALSRGSAVLNNNIISENTASKASNFEGWGGGVYQINSQATLNHNLIFNNTANRAGWIGGGGAILLMDAKATLHENSILSNTASLSGGIGVGGGIGLRFDSDITLDGDLIQSNIAMGTDLSQGGGLYFEGGTNPHTHLLTNTVIISNQINQQGAGIYLYRNQKERRTFS